MRATLEQICSLIVDCEHKTSPIDETGEYFAVGTPAMRGNVIDYNQARRISRETFEQWTRRLPPAKGDLLFAREAPVGPIVSIPGSENIAPGQRTVLMRVNPAIADPTFLYYLISSPLEQARIQALAAGSTVAHLNVADIRSFEVELPTLREQQAIAEVLGALDLKIAANTKLTATADKLATTILLGALHETKQDQLSSIATLTMGSSPTGATLNETGDGTVFYQGVRDFGVRFPSNRIWTIEPSRMALQGDTLISVRAPVGRVNIANEDLCLGRGLASARSSDGRPASLFHLLKSANQVWEPFESEGTVFGSINKKQLAEIELPRVRLDQSEDVEKSLQLLEEQIANALRQNETLAATRDALLPQLMSGKLHVNDAEALISSAV